MEKWTYKQLMETGKEIQNATIKTVSLNMENHGCLTLDIVLEGNGWGCSFGGYCLGHGYLGASDDCFKGYDKGLEAIMRIMDVVGVSDLNEMVGKNVRTAAECQNRRIIAIGNIVEDKWFDYNLFFGSHDGRNLR